MRSSVRPGQAEEYGRLWQETSADFSSADRHGLRERAYHYEDRIVYSGEKIWIIQMAGECLSGKDVSAL